MPAGPAQQEDQSVNDNYDKDKFHRGPDTQQIRRAQIKQRAQWIASLRRAHSKRVK